MAKSSNTRKKEPSPVHIPMSNSNDANTGKDEEQLDAADLSPRGVAESNPGVAYSSNVIGRRMMHSKRSRSRSN